MEENQMLLSKGGGLREAEYPSRCRAVVLGLAFSVLGVSSFIMSNAFWAELPIIYRRSPEGRKVAAFLILSLQCGNISPALFMAFRKGGRREEGLFKVIALLLSAGALVSVLLASLHDHHTTIRGHSTSLALFLLAFLSGAVSSTTNVTYFPLVGRYRKGFTTALLTGEGLNGFVAGILALAQNSGGSNPRFGLTTYFLVVSFIFVLSLCSLKYIHSYGDAFLVQEDVIEESDGEETVASEAYRPIDDESQSISSIAELQRHQVPAMMQLMGQLAIVGALAYGVVPSVAPMIVRSYKKSARALMWANVLGMITDPLARALSGFKEFKWHRVCTIVVISCAAVLIACAGAENPPGYRRARGAAFPVVIYGLFQFFVGYTVSILFYAVRRTAGEELTEGAYRWGGFAVQAGAFTGTSVAFLLVVGGQVLG